MFNYLNELAATIHQDNAKWWRDPKTGNKIHWSEGVKYFLVVSELAELGEGERKQLMDDHITTRRMAEVEMADAFIRLMDYAGAKQYDLDGAMSRAHPRLVDKSLSNMTAYFNQQFFKLGDHPAQQLMHLVCSIARCFEQEMAGLPAKDVARSLVWVLALMFDYAGIHEFDMEGAVAEKRAFNARRPDHTDTARLSAGGKKW